MDSGLFKRKRYSSHLHSKFPNTKYNEPYVGIFDGHSVAVFEKVAIYDIYDKGNFGKGSLSKSAPIYTDKNDDFPLIILEQQWENQLKWRKDNDSQTKPNHSRNNENGVFIDSVQDFLNFALSDCKKGSWKKYKTYQNVYEPVSVDKSLKTTSLEACSQTRSENSSDLLSSMVEEILQTGKIKEMKTKEGQKFVLIAENMKDLDKLEDFNISDVKIKLRGNFHHKEECLKLNLCEAFFLHFAVGCLKIINSEGQEMNLNELWGEFCKIDKNFIDKYVFYHHYRAYGWTVRSGLKFGGDFLLYKIGPMYYHASYLIWIVNRKKKNKMTWNEFIALNRSVETSNKDLLLCEVLGTGTEEETSPDILKEFSLLELTSKRWIPSKERELTNSESN